MIDANLQEIVSSPPLQVLYWKGVSDTLVVVFSGIGQIHEEQPPVEFFDSATEGGKNHALFVSDISRSWLNHEGMDKKIIEAINYVSGRQGISSISFIGNSMGGSVALFLREIIDVKSVLAFAPQYSIMHRLVPEERRWRRYRSKIVYHKYQSVTLLRDRGKGAFIVHGGSEDELAHALKFPQAAACRHFILPECGHNLASSLKKRGVLSKLVGASIHYKPYRFRRIIEREGGVLIKKFLIDRNAGE